MAIVLNGLESGIVMHQYHFLATDTDTSRQKMPIPIPYRYFGIQLLLTSNSNINNAFASLFNKTDYIRCLLAVPMASNQLLCGLFCFHYTTLVLLTDMFQVVDTRTIFGC